MKLKKVLATLMVALLLLLSICTNVYAEGETATVTLSEDSSSVFKVGQTVKINVDISVSGFDGVFEFLADLRYDKDVLKYTGLTTADGWRVNREDVYIERADQVDTKGRLCTLNFEVLKAEETTIKLLHTDASGNSGAVLYLSKNVNEPSITLKPVQEPVKDPTDDPTKDPVKDPTDDPTKEPVQDPADDPTKDPVQEPTEEPTTKTTTKKPDTAPSKIPQTGYFDLEIVLIGVMLIVTGVILVKYVKYKEIK